MIEWISVPPPQGVVRVIADPALSMLASDLEHMSYFQQAIAIRTAMKAGFDAADSEVRGNGLHTPCFPAHEDSYMLHVVQPAAEHGLLAEDELETWTRHIGSGAAIADPRVQSFLAAMSERLAIYRSTSADHAHRTLSNWLNLPLNAIRPYDVALNSFVVFECPEGRFLATPLDSDPLTPREHDGQAPEIDPVDAILREVGDPGLRFYSSLLRCEVHRSTFGEYSIYELLPEAD